MLALDLHNMPLPMVSLTFWLAFYPKKVMMKEHALTLNGSAMASDVPFCLASIYLMISGQMMSLFPMPSTPRKRRKIQEACAISVES
jgi:hypothetical protein